MFRRALGVLFRKREKSDASFASLLIRSNAISSSLSRGLSSVLLRHRAGLRCEHTRFNSRESSHPFQLDHVVTKALDFLHCDSLSTLSMSTFPYESLSRQTGLPHLPLELLRKIAKELTSRSHLQSFALVCRSTTLPARELLFDTVTLSGQGSSLLSSDYHLVGKTRLSPFPDLVRRLVLERVSTSLCVTVS